MCRVCIAKHGFSWVPGSNHAQGISPLVWCCLVIAAQFGPAYITLIRRGTLIIYTECMGRYLHHGLFEGFVARASLLTALSELELVCLGGLKASAYFEMGAATT